MNMKTPYTNFHELNQDWIIKIIKKMFSPDNPPPYPVESVNGKTGEVVLTGEDIDISEQNQTSIKAFCDALLLAIQQKYTLPSTGLPWNDLDQAVKNIINAKYTLPANGIPMSQLDTNVSDMIYGAIQANGSQGSNGQIPVSNGSYSIWTNPQDIIPDLSSDIASAVNTWLTANITNPSSPPLDRSLTQSAGAAPADMVGRIKNDLDSVTEAYTKNLFDSSQLNNGTIQNSNDAYTGTAKNFYDFGGLSIYGGYKQNTQYAISLSAYTTYSGATTIGLKINVDYTDGTSTSGIIQYQRNTNSYTRKTAVTTAGKTVSQIRFSYSNGANDTWYVKEIQIEEGDTSTDYIPFILTAIDYSLEKYLSLDNNANVNEIPANSDFDNYLTPGNYKVLTNAIANTISNIPTKGAGRLIVMNLNNDNNVVQFYIVYTRYIQYRVRISGSFTTWMLLNPIIYPKENGGDMATTIRSVLLFAGTATLTQGDYYISNLIMPEGSNLQGAGLGTKLHFLSTSTGSAITLGNNASIKDLTLMGSDTPITLSNTIGNRNGILWTETNNDPHLYGAIEHCHITGFNGAGIIAYDTNTPVHHNLTIDNCFIDNCNVGIYLQRNTEYNKICNSTIVWNYYGILNRGGNNNISNCGIDHNIIGIQIDASEGTNNGHGTIVSCSINHSGENNDGYGIVINTTGRMLISACNFYYSNILISNSNGNVINGCGFGSDANITITGGLCSIISNCMMRSSANQISLNGNSKLINCFTRDGADVIPTI